MTKNYIFGAIVVVVAIGAFFAGRILTTSNPAQPVIAGTTQQLIEQYDPYVRYAQGIRSNYPIIGQGGMQVGTNGTLLSNEIAGFCNPTTFGNALGATSTALLDCTVPGVTTADTVTASINNPSAVQGGIFIESAFASSTPGHISLQYVNFTGAATSSYAFATTSVEYWIVH